MVDDGSKDRTVGLAREKGATVVCHSQNRGLGAAVRTGLRAAVEANAEVVAYLDADLEYYPEDLPKLIGPILSGRTDYVLGSRFRGGIKGMKLYRRIGNYVFTALQVLLTRTFMTDGQTGMRAFSWEAARSAEIVHDYNYAQVLTLDLLRKGFPDGGGGNSLSPPGAWRVLCRLGLPGEGITGNLAGAQEPLSRMCAGSIRRSVRQWRRATEGYPRFGKPDLAGGEVPVPAGGSPGARNLSLLRGRRSSRLVDGR